MGSNEFSIDLQAGSSITLRSCPGPLTVTALPAEMTVPARLKILAVTDTGIITYSVDDGPAGVIRAGDSLSFPRAVICEA